MRGPFQLLFPVFLLFSGCATLSSELNLHDHMNEERLLQVPQGTSKEKCFRMVRKPDSFVGQYEQNGNLFEVFFYAFPDRLISPTRQNYYLVSFRNSELYRVVLAEMQPYDRGPAFQQFVNSFQRHQTAPDQQQQAEDKRMSALRNVLGISTDSRVSEEP